MRRARRDALVCTGLCLATLFISVQAAAAFVYNAQNPELTQMQVLMAAGEWAIPFRWLR